MTGADALHGILADTDEYEARVARASERVLAPSVALLRACEFRDATPEWREAYGAPPTKP